MRGYNELTRNRARELRRSATRAEYRLWNSLRRRQLGGFRFRRQQPIGPFIADFYCPAVRLIVELDSEQHGIGRHLAHDVARTLWLESRGYAVLRFANHEVLRETERVLDAIWRIAVARKAAAPPRNLLAQISTLPQGEGGPVPKDEGGHMPKGEGGPVPKEEGGPVP